MKKLYYFIPDDNINLVIEVARHFHITDYHKIAYDIMKRPEEFDNLMDNIVGQGLVEMAGLNQPMVLYLYADSWPMDCLSALTLSQHWYRYVNVVAVARSESTRKRSIIFMGGTNLDERPIGAQIDADSIFRTSNKRKATNITGVIVD